MCIAKLLIQSSCGKIRCEYFHLYHITPLRAEISLDVPHQLCADPLTPICRVHIQFRDSASERVDHIKPILPFLQDAGNEANDLVRIKRDVDHSSLFEDFL